MRILVTGAGGFVGRHLVQTLAKRGHQVFAGLHSNKNIFDEEVTVGCIDMLNKETIERVVLEFKPEGIIHLAAQTMVSKSWSIPEQTISTNVLGTINLINTINDLSHDTKIMTIGSSEEYGLSAKSGLQLTEDVGCFPQNPYATSKLASGQLALQLARKMDLDLVHIRPFNHFGPGQEEGFVISDFASQIVRIENGMSPATIHVGDLSAERDFTYIGDVINAYIMLIENDVENGIYNVCSETPRKINDILKFLIEQSHIKIQVEVDKKRLRPSEVPLFVGSATKIKKQLGWKPESDFFISLGQTLDWWRTKYKQEAGEIK
jgi:GDP-4-dehydro-6-deoxy-D-mannose reductase